MGGSSGDRHARHSAIVVIALICIAVVASAIYGVQVYRKHRAQERLAQLAENTWNDTDNTEEDDVPTPRPEDAGNKEEQEEEPIEALDQIGIPIPEKEVDFASLQSEVNKDIYAWIYIPDTQIDYPVLQSDEELDYYLDTNLDGSKGYPGCIYTQMMNGKDWEDKNTIIYGHNMRDGSMFANLHYFEDSDFFAEHPYVYIYTEEKLLIYQVFAAYEYSDRHILYFNDISTPEAYQRYLDLIFENDGWNDNFDTEIELDSEDRIITLSTCVGNKEDRRWLVQAVLTAERESD